MPEDKGNRRLLRVEKELRDVIGRFVISGLSQDLDGMVTVTRVQATSDFRNAKVFVTVLPDDAAEATVEQLQDCARDVQDEIHHQLKLRYTPKLTFIHDRGLEKQLKVEKILHDLAKERDARAVDEKREAKPKKDE
jgi:ribosome-binding factor A